MSDTNQNPEEMEQDDEIEQMDIEEIVEELEALEKKVASNDTEPLLAHTVLPLLSQLASYMLNKEIDDEDDIYVGAPRGPQGVYLSFDVAAEIREVLSTLASGRLLQGLEDDEMSIRARTAFFAMESQVKRIDIEEVAEEFEEHLISALQQRQAQDVLDRSKQNGMNFPGSDTINGDAAERSLANLVEEANQRRRKAQEDMREKSDKASREAKLDGAPTDPSEESTPAAKPDSADDNPSVNLGDDASPSPDPEKPSDAGDTQESADG